MTKIHAAIIEDEVPAARLLYSLVTKIRPQWDVTLLPGNVEDASLWFAENQHPDLLFLDIQLSDGTSFDLLSQVKPDSMVIFTTAYDEYAIRAFSVNSIDYILKPVDEVRLADAIEKYETLNRPTPRPEDYIDTLLDALQKRDKRFRTRFLIQGKERYRTLQVEDIAYFYSENKVTTAVAFTGESHVIDLSLSRLEEQLDPDKFFRANRHMLLSVKSISRIEPYFNGRISVKVHPPYKNNITVSEDRIAAFKAWLNY